MNNEFSHEKPTDGLAARVNVHLALKAAGLGVWELDKTTNLVNWDDRCGELFGLTRTNQLTYEQAIQHIHPADLSRVDEAVKRALNPGLSDGAYDVTYRTIGADDGLLRWVRFIGQATLDVQGHVMHFGGVAQDVTEDELARQLTISEERFRTTVEQAPVAMALFSGPTFVITLANERVLEYWGRGREQVMNKPLFDALPEASGQGFEELLTGVYITGNRFVAKELSVTLERNGQLQPTYIDFVYEAYREPTGAITGVMVTCIEITGQVLARRKAEEEKTRFRSLIKEAPVAACLFMGRELRIDVANEAMIAIWGKGNGILGKPLTDALPELRQQHFPQTLNDVFTTGTMYEAKAGRADLTIGGVLTTFYFDYTFKPLRNGEGAVYAILKMATDVTEAVLAKQKLQESETYFRKLTDTVPVIIWETEPDGYCSYLNKRWYELTGQTPAEAEGFGWLNATHPDDMAEASRLFLEANARKEPFYALYRLRQADATYRWAIDKASSRFAADGTYEGMIGTVVDIHEQVMASQQLTEQEAQFKNVTNSSPTGLWLSDDLGELTYLNKTLIDWTGVPLSDLLGAGWANAIIDEDRDRSIAVFTTAVAARAHYDTVFRLRKADGRVIWCQAAGDPYYHPDGRCAGYAGFCMDINEQVLVKQRIEESQQRLLSSFEAAPIGIAVLGRENLTFQMVNPAYAKLVDRPINKLVGKALLEAIPEIRGQGFDVMLDTILATGIPYTGNELTAQLMVGGKLSTVYFNTTYQPLYESGEFAGAPISGILAVALDVTEQVSARRKIEESEQQYRILSADLDAQVQQRTQQLQDTVQDLERSNQNLQQFAYVASHDLQEPLRKIQAFGDLLKSQYFSQLGEGIDHLTRMQSAATRMSVLIKDLLTYSRISTRQEIAESVSIGHVIQTVLSDLELVVAESGATVNVPPLPVVQGDRSQLGQLFQNLLSNALKFRRHGITPVVTFTAAYVPATELPATVRPTRAAASYYRLDVADNGIGFDEKHLGRIFQVFQRLHGRTDFAGTGIGLAICEKVAANHGGAITATSLPGQGATFSVYLPV